MTYYKDYTKIIKKHFITNQSILIEYEGEFSQEKVKEFAFQLNEISKIYIASQRRLFYVYVELAQNVGFYSDNRIKKGDKTVGCGSMIAYETKGSFGFAIGNIINKPALDVLKKKCEIINSLDRDSLREFKRHQRNLIPGTNGGAHIGLIMVSLTTRKKLDLLTHEIDEKNSFFSLNVEIEKEQI